MRIVLLFILIQYALSTDTNSTEDKVYSNPTNTSFFTHLDDLFIANEPSDRTFEFVNVYCPRGQYNTIDTYGDESCEECNLELFQARYNEVNLNEPIRYRHGKCLINSHHHICRTILREFMKCSQWSSVCPKTPAPNLIPTPYNPPVSVTVNNTCTYYRFQLYEQGVDMANRCNCDKNNVQLDLEEKWMVGDECTGYPLTLD